jgi:pyrrolysine biosynthesis protein PylC
MGLGAMRLGIVGGRLQGTEAAYLGAAAGHETVLIDRTPGTPASGLAAENHAFDVVTTDSLAREVLGSCDVVIPACEDERTLRHLDELLAEVGVPFAFHTPSHELTSSKIASDRLFSEKGLPCPIAWPQCGFPVVVKPSTASGSVGVAVARDREELATAIAGLRQRGHSPVVQRFVEGPSLSLEVMRTVDGRVATFLPTLLEFDAGFDCARVLAPVGQPRSVIETLADVSRRLAEAVGLVGLMDVEVMVDGDEPLVIEIDARLPSQTPSVVYHAIGVNLVDALARLFMEGTLPTIPTGVARGVCYQHVRAEGAALWVLGEHVMADAGPLQLLHDVYGADEILTDRQRGADSWSATLICAGRDAPEAREKAEEATASLAVDAGLRVAGEIGATPPLDARRATDPAPVFARWEGA